MANKMRLTGNDIALAEQGAALAIAWWKKQPGKSSFKRQQISSFNALIRRLGKISDHAYPYRHADEMPLTVGRERIMRLDPAVTKKTRAQAGRAKSLTP